MSTLATSLRRMAGALGALALATALPSPAGADEPAPAPPPLNVFHGRVVDHEGQAVPSAKVYVAAADNGYINYQRPDDVFVYAKTERFLFIFPKRNGRRSGEATTDANGRFEILGLKAGKYNVLAAHPERGAGIQPAVSQPNKDSPVEIKLAPPTFVRGAIPGLVAPGLRVNGYCSYVFVQRSVDPETLPVGASPPESEWYQNISISPGFDLNDSGKFQVGPLPLSGEYLLSVYQVVPKRNFSATLLQRPVSVEPGKTTLVNIDLSEGERLAGQVTGPEGKSLADVAITVSLAAGKPDAGPYGGMSELGALTDADGHYTIRGLPPGTHALTAKRWLPRTGLG